MMKVYKNVQDKWCENYIDQFIKPNKKIKNYFSKKFQRSLLKKILN